MEHQKKVASLQSMSKQIAFFLVFLLTNQITFGQTDHEVCTGYPLDNSKDARSEILLGSDGDITTYESSPGSDNVIYLDFDGEYLATSVWSSGPIDAKEASSLDNAERLEVCKRVAVDFQPFDVNVTSVRGVYEASKSKVHVIFTPTNYFRPGSGGVAEVGSWNYNFKAWVFSGSVHGAAEAASHEIGHTLKLRHDGIVAGVEYYRGHNDWGPIMGNPTYGTKMTQWSRGDYPNADNGQTDIGIISSVLPFKTDDYGSSQFDPSPIQSVLMDGSGNFEGKGLIAHSDDLDVFLFAVTGGAMNIQFGCDSIDFYNNLRLEAAIYDKDWNKVWSKNTVTMNEVSNVALSAGTYFLVFDGVGYLTPADGYSDYGSVGEYHFSGQITQLDELIDMAVTVINSLPANTCAEEIKATVTVKNNSSSLVGDYDVVISDKNGNLATTRITAPLASGASAVHEIMVTPSYFMDWTFDATVIVPGDFQFANNMLSSSSTSYRHGATIEFKLHKEARKYKWNWEIEDLNGNVLWERHDFELSESHPKIEIHEFCVPKDSCFNITVTDPFKSEWCSHEILMKYDIFTVAPSYVWQIGDTAAIFDIEGQGLFVLKTSGWVGLEIMTHLPSAEPENFTKIDCDVPSEINPEFTFTNVDDGTVLFQGSYYEGKTLFQEQICTYDLATSVEGKEVSPMIKVFPNPAIALVEIQTDESIVFIQVINTLGQVMFEVHHENKIDVSSLETGFYFLRVKTRTMSVHPLVVN